MERKAAVSIPAGRSTAPQLDIDANHFHTLSSVGRAADS